MGNTEPPIGQGINHIWNCDALTLLRALPSDSVDMGITSPPYDGLRNYNGYSFDFEPIAREAYRVLKPGGVLVWVVGDSVVDGSETLTSFKQALYFKEQVGFRLHDTMIYKKQGTPFPDPSRYYQTAEYMFVLSKGSPRVVNLQKMSLNPESGVSGTRRNAGDSLSRTQYKFRNPLRVMDNVWSFPRGYNHTTKDIEAFAHPAMFPEALAERHIVTWSNPGDLVIDFFMGSGTTAKMARNLGRHYIGCDVSADYVTLARTRLNQTDPFQDRKYENGITQLSLFSSSNSAA